MRELAVSQMKLSIPDKKKFNNKNFKKWKTFPVWGIFNTTRRFQKVHLGE